MAPPLLTPPCTRQADNPFVVKLFFCFQSKHNLYLVMEYLAGGDLHALLKRVGRLEEPLVRIYLAEMVLGLQARPPTPAPPLRPSREHLPRPSRR